MSAENNGSPNWGSVVVNLAIIGFVAFALYLTHSLWCLLGLLCLFATGHQRQAAAKPKKCRCENRDGDKKRCCGDPKAGGQDHDCGC